jgi:hypothetical protein
VNDTDIDHSPNSPEFVTVESIKDDIEAILNERAAWTPEWLQRALMSAWQEGHSAGDVSAYHGGLYKQRNPFMSPAEQKAWYES